VMATTRLSFSAMRINVSANTSWYLGAVTLAAPGLAGGATACHYRLSASDGA
jgi:hypothetical protein